MDEDDHRIEEVDRLRNLPDSLIYHILLNLPTKDVVKTSVLSRSWYNLWRYVPGLDIRTDNLPEWNDFVSFVDAFLGFNRESCLQSFKLAYKSDGHRESIKRWIDTAVKQKVQHLEVWYLRYLRDLEIPSTFYTCESLVSLTLGGVILPNPKLVSLPALKEIVLVRAKIPNDLALDMLISGCPLLETLVIHGGMDVTKVLRVCSHSLVNLTLYTGGEDVVVSIDTPRLQYLQLYVEKLENCILNSSASLVKVTIDTPVNTSLLDKNMVGNFLIKISSVKAMDISSSTLEVITRFEVRLALFRNLSSLSVTFYNDKWEQVLPNFLDSCPNLKSLSMKFWKINSSKGIPIVYGHWRFPTSLEYVKIQRPINEVDEAVEMKLASYILENSTSLKKFTLCLDKSRKNEESVILMKLLTIPRLSASCEVVVL